jgi:MPBQ/MSBQ methyltransferase
MDLNDRIRSVYKSRYSDPIHEGFFDRSGFSNFGYWYKSTCGGKEASINLVDRLLTRSPNKIGTILDVGCGQGGTTRRLMDFYDAVNIVAINIDEEQLSKAKANASGCNFSMMDAANLAFSEASFNNIICVEAAIHFNTRERFLKEAFRVLKPGGHLLLTDLTLRKLASLVSSSRALSLMPPENFLTNQQEYEKLCLNSGFKDAMVEDVTKQTWKSFRIRFMKFRWQRLLNERSRREAFQCLYNLYGFVYTSFFIRQYLVISAVK